MAGKALTILTAILTSLALIGTAALIAERRQASQGEAASTEQPQAAPSPPPAEQPGLDELTFDLDEATPAAEAVEAALATISTSQGEIKLKLYPDEAPDTVANFAEKAQAGFYDGLTFHRVEDWVIQGGDPQGDGGGGGEMPTELNEHPFQVGSVGMARGMDIRISNASQFFICIDDCGWLTNQYTNFGEVVEGLEVAKQIEVGDEILRIVTK